jgi:hypothetical protein
MAEIDELRAHITAKEAMMAFCKQVLSDGGIWFREKFDVARPGTMISFYIFSAPATSYSHYGVNFAKLIEDEDLGKVWESPKIQNKAYHPDHSNQMWVWIPNRDKLVAWWKANQVETKAKRTVGPGRP